MSNYEITPEHFCVALYNGAILEQTRDGMLHPTESTDYQSKLSLFCNLN